METPPAPPSHAATDEPSVTEIRQIPRLRRILAVWQAAQVIGFIAAAGCLSLARVLAKSGLLSPWWAAGGVLAAGFALIARREVKRRSWALVRLQEADIHREVRGESPLVDHGRTPIWDRPELKVRLRIVAVVAMLVGFFVLSPAEALWEQGNTGGAIASGVTGGGMFLGGLFAWRRTAHTRRG